MKRLLFILLVTRLAVAHEDCDWLWKTQHKQFLQCLLEATSHDVFREEEARWNHSESELLPPTAPQHSHWQRLPRGERLHTGLSLGPLHLDGEETHREGSTQRHFGARLGRQFGPLHLDLEAHEHCTTVCEPHYQAEFTWKLRRDVRFVGKAEQDRQGRLELLLQIGY